MSQQHLTQQVELKSSVILFGAYEYQSNKSNQLSPEFLVLVIKSKESLLLNLSFKHICKVEILDNSEGKGAGLVVHINDFMAQKLQEILDKGGKGFLSSKSSYAPNNFIVMDILNCDPQSIIHIKKALQASEFFHRQYVIDQCNKAQTTSIEASLPSQYICTIYYNQWKALLGSLQKDVYFEHIESHMKDQTILRYTIGKICNYKPSETYTLQQDGSIISKKKDSNYNPLNVNLNSIASPIQYKAYKNKLESTLGNDCLNSNFLSPSNSGTYAQQTPHQKQQSQVRYVIHSQQSNSKFQSSQINKPLYNECSFEDMSVSIPYNTQQQIHNQQQFHNSNSNMILNNCGLSPYSVTIRPTTQRRSITQKREVHVIEDEEEDNEVSASKKHNDTVFVYPASGGGHSCSVHYSDLKYLDNHYMLNDTIIDFYLKYIYYELISEQRRNKIFMFNSFFYSRLVQSPLSVRTPVSAITRSKRIQTNFQSIKSWTKRVNLFEKDYIIIPINEDIHWFLAVIVNPSSGIVSTNKSLTELTTEMSSNITKTTSTSTQKRPFLIIFDSLIENNRKHLIVCNILAEYLSLEFEDKKKTMQLSGERFDKRLIKLITPTGMPQQKNYVDCGVFLLQFAEIFMTNPPLNFNSPVVFRFWYPNFQIKGKREAIKAIIRKMASHVKYQDFLPEPLVAKKNLLKRSEKKSAQNLNQNIEIFMMQPMLARRHSESSISELAKEVHFTSIGMNSLSRSIDSILEEMKEMPPIVISFRDLLPNRKKLSIQQSLQHLKLLEKEKQLRVIESEVVTNNNLN